MEPREDLTIVAIATTVASLEQAQALARAVLEQRLAACVQVEPGLQSFYRWEGRVCEDPEVRLTLKTVPACVPALQALFARRHPYALPQFVATPAQASAEYAAWVRGELEPTGGSAASPDPTR